MDGLWVGYNRCFVNDALNQKDRNGICNTMHGIADVAKAHGASCGMPGPAVQANDPAAREIGLLHRNVDPLGFTIYLGAQSNAEIEDFIKTTGVHLNYVPVTFRQLQSMSSRVPAVQIVSHGEIAGNWIGEMPSADEIRRA